MTNTNITISLPIEKRHRFYQKDDENLHLFFGNSREADNTKATRNNVTQFMAHK